MSRPDPDRVRELFDRILDLPTGQQRDFLRAECGDDEALFSAVTRLLSHVGDAEHFLETSAPEFRPSGSRVGPYVLGEPLGRGGMGAVYRAQHEKTGNRAAVKTVDAARPSNLSGLRREIAALARVSHPRIARFLDSGVHEGVPWYAMELLEGRPLRRFAEQELAGAAGAEVSEEATTREDSTAPATGPTSPPRDPQAPFGWTLSDAARRRALAVTSKLCSPLAYLHGEGIVHRDLKPDNVVMKPGEEPVIVDFGLVIHSTGAHARDRLEIHEAAGTMSYMAPEQAAGTVVDARADLYSLGCLLHWLLTGRSPAQASPDDPTVVTADDAPGVRIDPEIPEDIQALLRRLLAPRPEERLGYAEDVAAALRRLGVEDPGLDSQPPTRAYLYRPQLVGREEDVQALSHHLDALMAGRGGAHLMSGESGVGKTRLALAAAAQARSKGAIVLTGACVPDTPRVPLGALRQAVVQALDVIQARGGAPENLARDVEFLSRYVPALPARPSPSLEPSTETGSVQDELNEHLASLFGTLGKTAPVLLVLDDLQWCDQLSLEYLKWVCDARSTPPFLIVGALRSEEVPEAVTDLGSLEHATVSEIGPLPPQAIGRLVSDMLALPDPPSRLVDYLIRESDGRPLFVASYLRVAVEEELLSRDGAGHWSFAGHEVGAIPPEGLPLPGTILELLARRLDRLDGRDRSVVNQASVFGPRLQRPWLLSAEAIPDAPFPPPVEAILESEGDQLVFSHQKLQEVAYARLPADERRERHARAARVLEEHSRGDRDERLAELAHHWHQAGSLHRARDYYLAAARHATTLHVLQPAEPLFRSFLELAGDDHPEAPRARYQLGALVLQAQGRYIEAQEEVERALALALQAGDRKLEAYCLYSVATGLRNLGKFEEAIAQAERSLGMNTELNDDALEIRLKSFLSRAHLIAGRRDQARRFAEEAASLAEGTNDANLATSILTGLVAVEHDAGDMERGIEVAEQALALARKTGALRPQASLWGQLGVLHFELRQLDEARECAERSLEQSRQLGLKDHEAGSLGTLAGVHSLLGNEERARELFLETVEISRRVGHHRQVLYALGGLALVELTLGHVEQARETIQRARGMLQDHEKFPVAVCWLDSVFARVLRDEGDLQEAQGVAQHALDMASLARNPTLQASVCVVLGGLHRLRGDFARSDEHLSQAQAALAESTSRNERVELAVERGYLALARRRDAGPDLELARELDAPQGSEPSPLVRKLARALEERENGHALLFGELPESFSPALRLVLERSRRSPDAD